MIGPEKFESSEFVSHMTPLILACHLNKFEMVRMLLRRGHTIMLSEEGACVRGCACMCACVMVWSREHTIMLSEEGACVRGWVCVCACVGVFGGDGVWVDVCVRASVRV